MDEKPIEKIMIPIEWYVPEGLKSQYVTNMVIQHTDEEFIMSFFEMKTPIILGSPEKIKSTFEHMQTVRAECVSRIIVTPKRMVEFIKVMQKNLTEAGSKIGMKGKADEPNTD